MNKSIISFYFAIFAKLYDTEGSAGLILSPAPSCINLIKGIYMKKYIMNED